MLELGNHFPIYFNLKLSNKIFRKVLVLGNPAPVHFILKIPNEIFGK
jgi:hypothetical protein